MSCSCLQSPCCCGAVVFVTPPCGTDCPPNASNTFQNSGMAGIGVFDNVVNGLVSFRSIEGDGTFITTTLDSTNHAVKVSVSGGVRVGQVFANAAARAAAVPNYIGQLGVQQDDLFPYLAFGTTAGNWRECFLVNGVFNSLTANTRFVCNSGGPATSVFQFTDASSGASIAFCGTDAFTVNGTSDFNGAATFEAAVDFQGAVQFDSTANVTDVLQVSTGAAIDFATAGLLKVNGVSIPGNSVVTTAGGAGQLSSTLKSAFVISGATNVLATATTLEFQSGASTTFDTGSTLNLSGLLDVKSGGQVKLESGGIFDLESGNIWKFGGVNALNNNMLIFTTGGLPTQVNVNQFASTFTVDTGWTTFTNPVSRKTCDTTTVTLPQLAQIVGTLIELLKTPKIPAP